MKQPDQLGAISTKNNHFCSKKFSSTGLDNLSLRCQSTKLLQQQADIFSLGEVMTFLKPYNHMHNTDEDHQCYESHHNTDECDDRR